MLAFSLLFLSFIVTVAKGDFVHFQPEQVHLSVNENGEELTVTWTTWNETESWVELGLSPRTLDSKVEGSSTKFMDGGKEKRFQFIHRVVLSGLEANTTYFYHVGGDDGWSDLFWFKTFPEGSKWKPRFAIFGDMGNANAQSLSRLQKETQAEMYDMIIHVGDFAYDMDTDNARVGDEFMRQIEAVAAYVPYMTCPGNHEQKYNYKARFSMPGNTESMFFSFNVGPIHFVSLSTEFYYFLNYGIKMVSRQYKWLLHDLEEANRPENRQQRPWIVVFGHRPMYCSGDAMDDCRRKGCFTRVGLPVVKLYGLEKQLMKYNVDLAIWAHEHNYERFWPLYDYKVYNGSLDQPYTNPRAPIHITTGSAGCQERHDGWRPKPPITAFRTNDYGYTRLTAHNGTHLEIEQVSDDKGGEVIDHLWIISDHHNFNRP